MAKQGSARMTGWGQGRVKLVALAALGLGIVLLALAASSPEPQPARAIETRNVEMVIAYPAGEAWETVGIVILLEDDGRDFATAAAEARAATLRRFPGGVEIAPQVAGQYAENGFKLPGHTAEWWYNPAGKPATLAGDYEAMRGGANAWNFAGGADFHFTEGGTTTDPPDICDGEGRDGRNTIGWADLAGDTLALTCYVRGQMPEFDIQFDITKPWTTGLTNVEADLQTVATHEFGHALGLGHTSDRSAVMYGSYRRGSLRRELTADDVAGLKAIYGLAPATPTPSATPAPTVSPTPGGGTAVSPQVVIPALSRQ